MLDKAAQIGISAADAWLTVDPAGLGSVDAAGLGAGLQRLGVTLGPQDVRRLHSLMCSDWVGGVDFAQWMRFFETQAHSAAARRSARIPPPRRHAATPRRALAPAPAPRTLTTQRRHRADTVQTRSWPDC